MVTPTTVGLFMVACFGLSVGVLVGCIIGFGRGYKQGTDDARHRFETYGSI